MSPLGIPSRNLQFRSNVLYGIPKLSDCIWHLTGHPVCTLRRRRSVSLPAARRTREINSPRRFRPLVRNATPAGAARLPPFVQLFASSTGRPIYCQSRYILHRADICARSFAGKDRRFCNCRIPIPCHPACILDPVVCINQRRGLVLSEDRRFVMLSSICLPPPPVPAFTLALCVLCETDKRRWPINFPRVRFCFRRRKLRVYILISHYEVQMNFLKRVN